MSIRYALGNALVSPLEMNEKARLGKLEKLDEAIQTGDKETKVSFSTGDVSLESFVPAALDEQGEPVSHEAIGIGRPLGIFLRRVYTGRFPKAQLFDKDKDLLVTTAMKGIEVYDGQPRAVNICREDVKAGTEIDWPHATEVGSPVVFYSPALTDLASVLTVEFAFDEFPNEVFGALRKAATGLAGLPLFAPASTFLLTAQGLMPVLEGIGELLLERGAPFRVTVPLTLNFAGERPTAAGWILLMENEEATRSVEEDYEVDATGRLIRTSDPTKGYDGPYPYAVLSLDGRKRENLEGFTPHAAQADMLQKFYGRDKNPELAADLLLDAVKVLSDWKFREQADGLAKKLEAAKAKHGDDSKEVKALQRRYDAAVKNILEEKMKPNP